MSDREIDVASFTSQACAAQRKQVLPLGVADNNS